MLYACIDSALRYVRSQAFGQFYMIHMPFGFCRRAGLDVLAQTLLGLHMTKDLGSRLSDWDKAVLDEGQQRYAALDVYASYEVMQKVLAAPDPRVCPQSTCLPLRPATVSPRRLRVQKKSLFFIY